MPTVYANSTFIIIVIILACVNLWHHFKHLVSCTCMLVVPLVFVTMTDYQIEIHTQAPIANMDLIQDRTLPINLPNL